MARSQPVGSTQRWHTGACRGTAVVGNVTNILLLVSLGKMEIFTSFETQSNTTYFLVLVLFFSSIICLKHIVSLQW